jgi:hypothetical protein
MRRLWLAGAVAVMGCQGVSPLTSKIAVGEEPLVIMVGTGGDNQVDLFAGSPGGGTLLTFTWNVSFPRHSPRRQRWPSPAGTASTTRRPGPVMNGQRRRA